MAVTKTAALCPAISTPGATVYLGNAAQSPPSSLAFAQGQISNVSTYLNKNSKAKDMAARYGAGGYGIGAGLGLTAGAGLDFTIADGQAVMDGIVEVYSLASQTATAASDNWVWLKQDGTIQIQVNTLTKPTGNCVLLGLVVAGASTITSVGTDGVVYWRGGNMWRETFDTDKPGDTPDSSLMFYTKTQGGLYFWNGLFYTKELEHLEGTWTPAVAIGTPGDSSIAYAQQIGYYQKIGHRVDIGLRLTFTPTWGTGSGIVTITGLPYTVGLSTTYGLASTQMGFRTNVNISAGAARVDGIIEAAGNSTVLNLIAMTDAGARSSMTTAYIATGVSTVIGATFSYFTAS